MWKVTLYIDSFEKLEFDFDSAPGATNFLMIAINHKNSEFKGKIEYIKEEAKDEV